MKNKNISVLGLGGVGGFLGAMLAKSLPHVRFIAREPSKARIEADGLTLLSDTFGTFTTYPEKVETVETMEAPDVLFLCVKDYQLDTLLPELKDRITDETLIIPVMNGAETSEKIRERLGYARTLDSVIYIVSFQEGKGTIRCVSDYAKIRIGSKDPSLKAEAAEISDLLRSLGLDAQAADDIEREIWKKYILNCAFNVETAALDKTIGELRADEKLKNLYLALLNEAFAVARRKGVQVTEGDLDWMRGQFLEGYSDGVTSSLQRDIRDHHPTEHDLFTGYLLREAERLGVPAPATQAMDLKIRDRICN